MTIQYNHSNNPLTSNEYLETLRQSIISRLQQSIEIEEHQGVLDIKEHELENIKRYKI
ncbi:hypothetical protein PPL_07642 [Heterostelium album PN500]|uniref:Uncharacterized protein n=1 Tax=Heterostelium pallidum (strain ATCC 26659 / Pp 5 / PN500) TaxID=670386 RepID=D3BGJ0_HETP5|nr:hypothetical protein PPL_07642 [Heterostelium album PN500]EFA79224.1 hypothetical protein PPL_07642 [Heterostelium album PN500]|eukprot:XP_020431345.1 hypothetical protein PPL_07642 [Heterostelium album PN500]